MGNLQATTAFGAKLHPHPPTSPTVSVRLCGACHKRKAWLFADTPAGAKASAGYYSLIETAKANGLEPYAYLQHVIGQIAAADTDEALEALLPWNVS